MAPKFGGRKIESETEVPTFQQQQSFVKLGKRSASSLHIMMTLANSMNCDFVFVPICSHAKEEPRPRLVHTTMAQTGLRSFYPVRRRREDDTYAAAKRRKLTENSHLEVLPLHVDTSKEKVAPLSDESTVTKKRTTRTKKSTTTAKKVQSGGRGSRRARKGASTNTKDMPNIQTLFKLINETNQEERATIESKQTDHTSSNTVDTPTDHYSNECPLPTRTSASTSKESTPKSSPFKAPLVSPLSKSKPTTPLKSSPLKAATAPSPAASLSVPETRGARLLRLAREKMSTKSPDSKTAPPSVTSSPAVERSKKMASRRKLLVSDGPLTTNSRCQSASSFFSSEEESREKMVGELYVMSKAELAQPTRFERGKKIKLGQKVDGEKEKEPSSNMSPKLREFGAFVFESPTKGEASKTK